MLAQLAFAALAAPEEALPPIGTLAPEGRAPVVGGSPTGSASRPVAALVDAQGTVSCTAVPIHPRWVLTAAHCLETGPVRVWWGDDLRTPPPDASADILSVRVDPDYVAGDDHAHDAALLELASEAPGPIARLAGEPPAPGDPLDAAGYGATADGADDAGLLRATSLEVLAVEPGILRTYAPGANLCSGDSGAPLTWASDPMLVVGVGAFVDPTCLGGTGGSVRIDAIWPFLSSVIPDLAAHPLPTGTESETETETGADTGPEGSDPGGDRSEPRERCGCGTGSPTGWGVLALVGWAMVSRRSGRAAPHPRHSLRTSRNDPLAVRISPWHRRCFRHQA